MMRIKFRRPPGFNTQARRVEKDLRGFVTSRLILGLTQFHKFILETPVYTGRTLVNYRWSLGGPITSTRPAIKDPPLPGTTNEMALGSEPRRSANAQVINEEFAQMIGDLRINPFQSVFLNNNMENFSDIEYGRYAKDEDVVSRTPPGGMTRRGETALEDALEGIGRRVA